MNKKLAAEAVKEIKTHCHSGDIEVDHSTADKTLCWLLRRLGYHAVVNEWEAVEKWYA